MGRFRYNKHRNYNHHVRDNDNSVEQEVPVQRSHTPVEKEHQGEMTYQYDRNDLPNPKRPRFAEARENVNRLRNSGLVRRVQDWNDRRNAPPTMEEIQSLKLRAERERLRTEVQGYKTQRRGMLFASYNPPVSRAKSGGARRSSVPYRNSGYYGGGMGFGFGSILRDSGGFGARQGSQGRFGIGTFGHGLDTMLGHTGYRGARQSRTRSRAKPLGYGSNLSKMFGI